MSHHFIKFTDVHYSYPNGVEALKGIDFLVTHGEKVALLGRNGSGKSTALLLADGLLLPTRGEVNVGDVPVTKKTLPLIHKSVGLLFQNPDDQLFMPTVEEDVAFGPMNMKLPLEEVGRRVESALRAVGCGHLRRRRPDQLSGGQKRRVALATVLSMEPDVLVLDEPTSNLDWHARREFMEIIKGFSHTCLIASHDEGLIRELCPRTIVIDDGRILADTLTDRVFADNTLMKTLGEVPSGCFC